MDMQTALIKALFDAGVRLAPKVRDVRTELDRKGREVRVWTSTKQAALGQARKGRKGKVLPGGLSPQFKPIAGVYTSVYCKQ